MINTYIALGLGFLVITNLVQIIKNRKLQKEYSDNSGRIVTIETEVLFKDVWVVRDKAYFIVGTTHGLFILPDKKESVQAFRDCSEKPYVYITYKIPNDVSPSYLIPTKEFVLK